MFARFTLSDITLHRLAAFCILTYSAAVSFEIRWHRVYWLASEHTYTALFNPHLLLNVLFFLGVAFAMALHVRGKKISMLFLIYPATLLLDVVLSQYLPYVRDDNPAAFWTPTRILVGVSVIAALHALIAMRIETSKILKTLYHAFAYFILPYRLILFIASPLGLYSMYRVLEPYQAFLVSILTVLVFISLVRYFKDSYVPAVAVAAAYGTGMFFVPIESIYNTNGTFFIILLAALYASIAVGNPRILYPLGACMASVYIFILHTFHSNAYPSIAFLLSYNALAIASGYIYARVLELGLNLIARVYPQWSSKVETPGDV